jgi:ribonuclease P protein component
MTTSAPAKPKAISAPPKLRHRRDFVRAAKSGLDHSTRIFKLQTAARRDDDLGSARYGFTVTKKVAGAVGRNRIRRRLKEALRLSRGVEALVGHDYVFIARRAALTAPFPELLAQIGAGMTKLNRRVKSSRQPTPKNRLSAP